MIRLSGGAREFYSMKKFIAAAFFVTFVPNPALAKSHWRKFRGNQQQAPHSPLTADTAARGLPGVGEIVRRESQRVGLATVAGSWQQTITSLDGKVTYRAGAMVEGGPKLADLSSQNLALTNALEHAMKTLPELTTASRIFPPALEVTEVNGEWRPYWRVEYLTPAGDQLAFTQIGADGSVLSRGNLDWDGIDGKAIVFPNGGKAGAAKEEPLYDLNGDGTVTGRLLHVFSALDLKVWSPQLTFFFQPDDRRFDLGQAYFTINQGYRWMKDHLGVELDHPIDVRLHVGDSGVSNAAFYHADTIYLGTGDNVIYKDMIRDPSILVHESIHAVIDAYAGLPPDGEGGSFNEGFADLFAGLILDTPLMGAESYLQGPYRRTLENKMMAYSDFVPGVYQNGSIVGGTFWDMKINFGNELTAKLAFRTLVRLGKDAKFDDFPGALASAADGLLNPEQTAFALSAARARGWKVAP
jgi:hypothetical protein